MSKDITAPFLLKGKISDIAVQPSGRPVLFARRPWVAYSAGGTLHVSDYETGQTLCRQESTALPIAFARDGRLLAVAKDSLWLFGDPWDKPLGIEIAGNVTRAWANEREILVLENDKAVHLLDLGDQEARRIDLADRLPGEVALATCNGSGAVAVLYKVGSAEAYKPLSQLLLLQKVDGGRAIISAPFNSDYPHRLILGEDGLNVLVRGLRVITRFRADPEEGTLKLAGSIGAPLGFSDVALGTETLVTVSTHDRRTSVFRLGEDLEFMYGGSMAGEVSDLAEFEGTARFAVAKKNTVRVFELNDADLVNLKSQSKGVALQAIRNVGRRRLAIARARLEELLSHDEQEVRTEAVTALGHIADEQSAPVLIRLLGLRKPGVEPPATMAALDRFERSQLAELLPRMLSGTAPDQRGAARYLAGRLDTPFPEALCGLQACLGVPEPDAETRQNAARTLGRMADLRATLLLLTALGAKEREVREAAGEALKETLLRNGLLDETLAAQLAQPIDLVGFAETVVQRGRLPQPGVASSSPVETFLCALSSSVTKATPSLDQLHNAVESLTMPRADLPSRRAKGLGLVVALVFADQFRSRQEWQAAQEIFTYAASLAVDAQVPTLLWRCQKAIGECHQSLGQDHSAAQAFGAAMETIDKLWFALVEDETLDERTLSFFAEKADLYEQAALCNVQLGHPALALECLEKAKTRYLGDLIARRQKKRRHELVRELSGVWQLVDSQTPEAALGEARETGERIVITGVAKAEGAEERLTARPKRLLELEEKVGPDAEALNRVWGLQDMWNAAAHVTSQEVLPEEQSEALSELYECLLAIRSAVTSGELPVPEHIPTWNARFRAAADYLYRESSGFGFFSDFACTIAGWASGEVEWEHWPLFLEAVIETLDLALKREQVHGRLTFHDPDHPRAVRGLRFDHAVTSEPSDLSLRATTVNRAFRRLSSDKWKYMSRAARGVTATFQRNVELLCERPRTAQVQFGVTKKGTIAYITFASIQGGLSAGGRSPADHLEVIHRPALTLDALHQRLVKDANGWFIRYRGDVVCRNDARSWFPVMDSTLAWLADELWSPIHELLLARGVERLRIVPHRILQLVPFAALPTGRSFGRPRALIDSFDLHFAPSFTLYDLCTERAAGATRRPERFTAVCDPTGNLPFAMVDVLDHVARLPANGAEILRRDDATVSRVQALELGKVLHFGGHAKYDWNEPLDSHLVLNGSQRIELGQLFEGSFPVQGLELVTLSACETSLVKPDDPADEWLGLASGFLFGGARSVISTLWQVHSLATALLLSRFYKLHLGDGVLADRALREAQRWLRDSAGRGDAARAIDVATAELASARDKARDDSSKIVLQGRIDELSRGRAALRSTWSRRPFAHPYYWAGFTLSGNVERTGSQAT